MMLLALFGLVRVMMKKGSLKRTKLDPSTKMNLCSSILFPRCIRDSLATKAKKATALIQKKAILML